MSGCVFCVNGIWLVTPVAEWVALAQDFASRTNTGIIIDILENEKSWSKEKIDYDMAF